MSVRPHMVFDKVAGMVADMTANNFLFFLGWKKFLADMDLDMVVDKEVDKLVDMVAGHGCWLIGPKLVGPNLDTRLTHLLSFGSLFGS